MLLLLSPPLYTGSAFHGTDRVLYYIVSMATWLQKGKNGRVTALIP